MRQGPWGYNYNSPVPNDRPFIDKPRPYPNYPEIYYITNGAGHQYNGLTAEVKRQMVNGLYFQGSWTWARDIYDEDYNWDFGNDQFIASAVICKCRVHFLNCRMGRLGRQEKLGQPGNHFMFERRGSGD